MLGVGEVVLATVVVGGGVVSAAELAKVEVEVLAAPTSPANPSTIQATASHRIRLPVAPPEPLTLLRPAVVPSRRPKGRLQPRGVDTSTHAVDRWRSARSRAHEMCETRLPMVLHHSFRCAADAGAEQQRRPRQARGVVRAYTTGSGSCREPGAGRLPPPLSPCTCRWASMAKARSCHGPGRAAAAVSKAPGSPGSAYTRSAHKPHTRSGAVLVSMRFPPSLRQLL